MPGGRTPTTAGSAPAGGRSAWKNAAMSLDLLRRVQAWSEGELSPGATQGSAVATCVAASATIAIRTRSAT